MTIRRFFLPLLLCAVCPVHAGGSDILVLGDSLSAAYGIAPERGWVSLLQQRLRSQGGDFTVINASISGDTTAGGVSRLPRLLKQRAPGLVLIALGSNDGLRGFGFDQIRQNLDSMIRASRDAGARVVLVGGMLPPNYGPAYAQRFADLFREVAGVQGVALVPFLLEGVAEERRLFQADGYHPTAEAQPRLLDNVWPVLDGELDFLRKER